MSDDFTIEADFPHGVAVLGEFLNRFPFPVQMGTDEALGDLVLVQSAVSAVAGFLFRGRQGSVHSYDLYVRPGQANMEVLQKISDVLKAAQISHRICRIHYEVEWEDEVLSYEAPVA